MKRNFCSVRFLATCCLFLCLVQPIHPRSFDNAQKRDASAQDVGPSTIGITHPTLQAPEAETEPPLDTTPRDLDLTFDTMTTPSASEESRADSSETTTSVTSSSSSVVVKSGRHFGSRLQSVAYRASATTPPGINNIPTALKPRPISYNPTNYNRILKRRQNQTVINPELSDSKDLGAQGLAVTIETTEDPSSPTFAIPTLPTTSQHSIKGRGEIDSKISKIQNSRIPPTNESLMSSETEFPTTNFPPPRNPPVKIAAIRLPTLPPTKPAESAQAPAPSPTGEQLEPSNSWGNVHRGPMPPPPTFDPDEDFTLYPDGIYKFKYSSAYPSVFTSSRIYTEEFGITDHGSQRYWDDPEGGSEGSGHDPEASQHTTKGLPEHDTMDPSLAATPTVAVIDGSEDGHFTPTFPPLYRDYFAQDLKPRQADSPDVKQITVTVTVTEKVNNTKNRSRPSDQPAVETIQNENLVNFMVIPTPVLPGLNSKVSDPESSKIGADFQLSPTRVSHNASSEPAHAPSAHGDPEQEPEIYAVSSPKGSFDLDPTPSMTPDITSKEFKSVFYSTEQRHPHFTSTQYSYASSTEFSFTYPSEDEDHQGQDHGDQDTQDQDGHHPNQDHDLGDHEFQGGNSHDHETDADHQYHHRPVQKNFIQPTTSILQHWDVIGAKTNQLNQSEPATTHPTTPEVPPSYPIVTTPQSTQLEGNDIKKGPDPTIPSASEEDSKKIGVTTTGSPVTANDHFHNAHNHNDDHAHDHTHAHTQNDANDHGQTQAHDILDSATSREPSDEMAGDFEPTHLHLPNVPSVIQIFLDLPPTQFCSNVKTFKETIILVYKYNNRHITLDQVVVYNESSCATSGVTRSKSKSATRRSSNSSPSTNTAWNNLNNKDVNGSDEKVQENSLDSKQVMTHAPLALYPVYVYIIFKNGTYDQVLTEAFFDLWNVTNAQGMLLFSKIKKVEIIISSDMTGGDGPANENTGVIAAITVASIAAFALLILGILLLVMRHRQAQNNFAKRCTPVTLDDYSLDNISVFNSFRRKQRNRASKRSYTNAGFDDPNAPSNPLNTDGLGTAVKEVARIYEEFSRIPSVLPTLDDIPTGAESKNRYANVIPMPDTRVLLTFQDEQPNSDYINANFVQGANATNKAYIITQGPLEETLIDFWRMIWEQQVRVIFMLTDFAEAGIPKCAEYYPRTETIECSQLHGDFQITLEKREVSENCITSFLVLKDMGRSLRRDVVHLWYHSWPEKGVPQTPQPTVDFLLKSRKYTREPTPILVHCSPGTGRSGTLVVCDIGLRQLEADRKADIPQIVKQLRHDRAGAVQTKDQYKHVYEVLQHYGAKYLSRQSKDS